jgi:hypothetical protein
MGFLKGRKSTLDRRRLFGDFEIFNFELMGMFTLVHRRLIFYRNVVLLNLIWELSNSGSQQAHFLGVFGEGTFEMLVFKGMAHLWFTEG